MHLLKLVSLLFFVTVLPSYLFSNLSISGSYQGKNIYVLNPEAEGGFGFCTRKVTVNGDVLPGSTGSSAFEIDFSLFKLQIGDPVFIVIEHNVGCTPKIINPEVLLPRSTFTVLEMNINSQGKLTWKTQNEKGKLPFIIEQYRWDKWVAVGEVEGKGTNTTNSYEFQVLPHSGQNIVRVAQIDHSGEKKPSNEVKFNAQVPEVKKSPEKVKTTIQFTANGIPVETKYEIFDAYGNLVKKGFGSSVDCSNLVKGAYYINFDNKSEKFLRG
jgi:hypothetical protein